MRETKSWGGGGSPSFSLRIPFMYNRVDGLRHTAPHKRNECAMTKFNDAEVAYLRGLDAVDNVTSTRIIYSRRFKTRFLHEYWNGKSPTEIFRNAGMPVVIIGSKRIERCTYRWIKDGRDKDIASSDNEKSESNGTNREQRSEQILIETREMMEKLSEALLKAEKIIEMLTSEQWSASVLTGAQGEMGKTKDSSRETVEKKNGGRRSRM